MICRMILFLCLQCKSAERMQTLFGECFETSEEYIEESIDPMLWVFIGLIILTVILMVAVAVLAVIRYRKKKSGDLTATSWTTMPLSGISKVLNQVIYIFFKTDLLNSSRLSTF